MSDETPIQEKPVTFSKIASNKGYVCSQCGTVGSDKPERGWFQHDTTKRRWCSACVSKGMNESKASEADPVEETDDSDSDSANRGRGRRR